MNKHYVAGFVKRAAQHGISAAQAVQLLKSGGLLPPPTTNAVPDAPDQLVLNGADTARSMAGGVRDAAKAVKPYVEKGYDAAKQGLGAAKRFMDDTGFRLGEKLYSGTMAARDGVVTAGKAVGNAAGTAGQWYYDTVVKNNPNYLMRPGFTPGTVRMAPEAMAARQQAAPQTTAGQ